MTPFTIYVTRRIWDDVRQCLTQAGSVVMWDGSGPVPRNELLTHIRDADALLCGADYHVDNRIIAAAPHLRVISTMSAGIDHIDLDAAPRRHIIVCHTPGAADESVADLTMALLLACARHLVDADDFVNSGQWQYWSPDLFLGVNVQGSTLGIIGLGYIWLEVAHRARFWYVCA